MPTYRVKLTNGKSLVLRGDVPPTDADIEAAAAQAAVQGLLVASGGSDTSPGRNASADASALTGPTVGASMAAAPAAVSMINRLAAAAGKVAATRAAGVVPALVAADAAGDVLRGDPKRAATKATGAVAASQAPRAIRAVQAATSPARTVAAGGASKVLQASGAAYDLPAVTTPGGIVSRVASTVSRLAGPVGLAIDAVTTPGHRPPGETPERTAARQADFAHQFKDQVNREAGYEVIKGSTVPEIIEAIAHYRSGK